MIMQLTKQQFVYEIIRNKVLTWIHACVYAEQSHGFCCFHSYICGQIWENQPCTHNKWNAFCCSISYCKHGSFHGVEIFSFCGHTDNLENKHWLHSMKFPCWLIILQVIVWPFISIDNFCHLICSCAHKGCHCHLLIVLWLNLGQC